jgi:hypothetical protein
VKAVALFLGAVATAAMWLLLDDVSPGVLVLLSAYMISPWLVVAAEGTPLSPKARVTALVVLSVMTIATYLSADDSSTGGIGVLLLPVYEWIAVAVIAVLAREKR